MCAVEVHCLLDIAQKKKAKKKKGLLLNSNMEKSTRRRGECFGKTVQVKNKSGHIISEKTLKIVDLSFKIAFLTVLSPLPLVSHSVEILIIEVLFHIKGH